MQFDHQMAPSKWSVWKLVLTYQLMLVPSVLGFVKPQHCSACKIGVESPGPGIHSESSQRVTKFWNLKKNLEKSLNLVLKERSYSQIMFYAN